jgi:lipopolysaccharide/colanic/teichoic acid biosynthesis glycosyltransferase
MLNYIDDRAYVFAAPAAREATAARGRSCWYPTWKRALELLLALALLFPAMPVIVLLMVLVRLTSRGPALYKQVRVGLDGGLFVIYKIRTMIDKIEKQTGPRWSTRDDPRVTPIGDFLRRTHLDELPQLWNILRGEMSLVGPRPERPEFVAQLERVYPRYRERLLVRPGLAGLAQSRLPPDTEVEGVKHKLAFDLYYMQHLSLSLDLRILACTGLFLLGIPFCLSCRLLWIPTQEMVEGTGRGPKAARDEAPRHGLELEVDAARVQPEPV